MRRRLLSFALFLATAVLPLAAQRLTIGIAPAFDAGSDDAGPAIVQHLSLFLYRDLLKGNVFAPALLNPGGAYSSFDTSWLSDYVRDRSDLDILLVTTLKQNAKDGSMVVDVVLLDAHTGAKLTNWTATSAVENKRGWMKSLGTAVTQGGANAIFEKGPLAAATGRVADSIRDALPVKTAGISHVQNTANPVTPATPTATASCVTHTHVTYGYKHAASRSQLLLVNDLDQTLTLKDGLSTFMLPEGPMLVQFSPNDAPYSMTKQPFYQLSTIHSCTNSTLVIDLGPQGDEHHHWE